MIDKKIIGLTFCLILIIEAMGQNGWTKKKKSFYAQLSYTFFQSSDYYSTESKLFNQGATFKSRGVLFYGEYGIYDRLNAVIDIPLVVFNSYNTTETVVGMGSAKLGLKYRLFKKTPVSLQIDAEIPTNNGENFATTKTANEFGYKDQINLPTSDGEFNVWTTLAASKSINKGKTYGSLYSAVNFRTQNYSNQFIAGLELGHLFFNKFYLIGKLRAFGKIKSKNRGILEGGSFLYGEGTAYTQYTFTGIYKVNKKLRILGAYTNYADFIIKRGNIYSGPTFSLGVSLEY